MNVGFIGLGKLGLPVAATLASRGLSVYGVDPRVSRAPDDTSHEEHLAEALKLAEDDLKFCGLKDMVAHCDVCFLAVQTPHDPQYEGITPLPAERADFDYSWLKVAVVELAQECERQQVQMTVAVISTVLPGTMEREIMPLLGDWLTLVYNPSFIAMGTVVRDFINPEFVLLGGDDDGRIEEIYRKVEIAPRFVRTSIRNAELIKVAYNTFIGMKVVFANTLMEVAHKTGCDVDEVTGALQFAHRRLISGAYLTGGMGDGGACHPRDNIALSSLARRLDLSYDWFEAVMSAREMQARWLVDLMCGHDLPKAILGVEFKPGTDITTGSAAVLVANLLRERGEDVVERRRRQPMPWTPHVFLIGCMHPEYYDLEFPAGSVVIDPHRFIPDQEGVSVIRVGEAAGGRRGVFPAVGDSGALGQPAEESDCPV